MKKSCMLIFTLLSTLALTGCGGDDKQSATPATAEQSAAPAASANPSELYQQAVALREKGTSDDLAAAFKIFSQAAEMGERDSMFFLGVMYENGESVPVDYQKALTWLEKSRDAGNGSAEARIKQLKAKMKK